MTFFSNISQFQVCRSVCNCMLVTDDSTGVNVGANSFTSISGSSVHFGFGLSSNGTLVEETVCVGGVNDGRACCKYLLIIQHVQCAYANILV